MFKVTDKKRVQTGIVLLQFFLTLLLIRFLATTISTSGIVETALISFGLLFALPMMLIKTIFKNSVREYNFNWPQKNKFLVGSFLLWMFFVSAIFVFVLKFGGERHLVASGWLLGSTGVVFFVNLFFLPIIVFSFEFFFRGFLLETFRRTGGVLFAVLTSSVLFMIFLYATGAREFHWLDAIFVFGLSLILGWTALKNRSIFVSALFHWMYLFLIDSYGLYRISQIIKG